MGKPLGRFDRFTLFIATGFGLGKAPMAPGTFGTLAGLPLIFIMVWLSGSAAVAFYLVCLILFSVWVADRAEKLLGQKDPGCIVIDEMAGYCIALSLVPVTFSTLVAGFAAFRCFDIVKPAPVRYFERKFNGGAGVVLDDIMAGVLAALLLKLVRTAGLL
ncbi:MAG TPA: phosphatidylglycerophosphatase A [Desulfobacteraceae bacterium]|nr:phosphatidylglycerophosphatase A [Desulfobacteraceae bacterium]